MTAQIFTFPSKPKPRLRVVSNYGDDYRSFEVQRAALLRSIFQPQAPDLPSDTQPPESAA